MFWTPEVTRTMLDYVAQRLVRSRKKSVVTEACADIILELTEKASSLGVTIEPYDVIFSSEKQGLSSTLVLGFWEPPGDVECIGGPADGEVLVIEDFCTKCPIKVYAPDESGNPTEFIGEFALSGWSDVSRHWRYSYDSTKWVFTREELCLSPSIEDWQGKQSGRSDVGSVQTNDFDRDNGS